jgi:hypothetical protein
MEQQAIPKPRPSPGLRPGEVFGTFGLWANLSQRLAKSARRLLSEGACGAEHCREMFAAQDQDLIDVLASSELSDVLQAACADRNS